MYKQTDHTEQVPNISLLGKLPEIFWRICKADGARVDRYLSHSMHLQCDFHIFANVRVGVIPAHCPECVCLESRHSTRTTQNALVHKLTSPIQLHREKVINRLQLFQNRCGIYNPYVATCGNRFSGGDRGHCFPQLPLGIPVGYLHLTEL